MKTLRSEIVIVGSGLAGIVAAIELLDKGHRVLIIDRDIRDNLGGLARWAFGGMFFVDSPLQRRAGIKDSVDQALNDWFSFAEFDEQEEWGKKWAEQFIHLCTAHGYDWLRKKNISFFPVINWVERGLFQQGNSVPRFHMVWGTGWHLTHTLVQHLLNHKHRDQLELLFEHRVTALIETTGKITGVAGHAEGSNAPFEAHGEQVIIATGGINGCIEKVKQNWYKPWGEPPEKILNGAHQYAVGDLHEAAKKQKANIVNLEKQWNYAAGIHHHRPRKPAHGLSLVPCKSALWLDFEGRRIGPTPLVTAYDTRFLVEQICKQPVKYSWQLLNMKIARKEFAISGSEFNPLIRDRKFLPFIWQTAVSGRKKLVQEIIEHSQDVVTASSLEELAEKMNAISDEKAVHKSNLEAAVDHYDNQIRSGKPFQDRQLQLIEKAIEYRGDRVRTCKFQRIADNKAMPFIALKTYIVSRKSLGGIQTDLDCRVLSQPNQQGHQHVIPGLYAIGEAAGFGGGGIHGYRSLEGTFLGGCVITGRVAAAAINNEKLS